MSADIAKAACESFLEYMTERYTQRFDDSRPLADYIEDWLSLDGTGVIACSGKFEIFLKAVALIVDEWHRNPRILDCNGFPELGIPAFPRRPSSALGDDGLHKIFDADNFAVAVFLSTHVEPNNMLRRIAAKLADD